MIPLIIFNFFFLFRILHIYIFLVNNILVIIFCKYSFISNTDYNVIIRLEHVDML